MWTCYISGAHFGATFHRAEHFYWGTFFRLSFSFSSLYSTLFLVMSLLASLTVGKKAMKQGGKVCRTFAVYCCCCCLFTNSALIALTIDLTCLWMIVTFVYNPSLANIDKISAAHKRPPANDYGNRNDSAAWHEHRKPKHNSRPIGRRLLLALANSKDLKVPHSKQQRDCHWGQHQQLASSKEKPIKGNKTASEWASKIAVSS